MFVSNIQIDLGKFEDYNREGNALLIKGSNGRVTFNPSQIVWVAMEKKSLKLLIVGLTLIFSSFLFLLSYYTAVYGVMLLTIGAILVLLWFLKAVGLKIGLTWGSYVVIQINANKGYELLGQFVSILNRTS